MPASTKYTSPVVPRDIISGLLRVALVAAPPSPVFPVTPVPAKVDDNIVVFVTTTIRFPRKAAMYKSPLSGSIAKSVGFARGVLVAARFSPTYVVEAHPAMVVMMFVANGTILTLLLSAQRK